MIRKISIVLFVLAVLVTGYISFRKLNYWNRSVMIFKYDSSQPFSRGRGGRDFGESRGREGAVRPEFRESVQRPGSMNIPDSISQRRVVRGQRNLNRMMPETDTLNRAGRERDSEFSERGGIPGGSRGQGGFGGRDFRRGSTVNLRTVLFYLGVFALFTAVTFYTEKGYRRIFKQNKLTQENSDLII